MNSYGIYNLLHLAVIDVMQCSIVEQKRLRVCNQAAILVFIARWTRRER
jgi:hypothetical protein